MSAQQRAVINIMGYWQRYAALPMVEIGDENTERWRSIGHNGPVELYEWAVSRIRCHQAVFGRDPSVAVRYPDGELFDLISRT